MKILILLMIFIITSAFSPFKKEVVKQTRPGFYVYVENYSKGAIAKFIVESKDSLNMIFNSYLDMELELGEVQRPLSIYNGNVNFYVARVNLFENPNGKTKFMHLQYPRIKKRSKLKPAVL